MIDFTPLGHACATFATANATVLCDPHFCETYGQGLFVHEPRRRVDAERLARPDLVVVTHRHRDHFDVRSLALLPRDVRVVCARDDEILYCLGRLGFHNVSTMEDWQTLRVADLELLVTPSLYRVPEHGILFSTAEESVWNMVDSVVDVAMVAEALRGLGRGLDLLLWPYQPLQETFAVENESLDFPDRELERKLRILELVDPRCVVPYADGQVGTGAAEWLNHYRFPVDFAELASCIGCSAQVLEPKLGQRIRLNGRSVDLIAADIPFELAADPRERSVFDTTREPSALLALDASSQLTDGIEALHHELSRLWQRLRRSEPHEHVMGSVRAAQAVYDIVVEIDGAERTVRFDHESVLVHEQAPPRLPGRQGVLRIRADTLSRLLRGDLHYISAYLGGAFRAWHSFYRIGDQGLTRAMVNRSGLARGPFVNQQELPGPAMFLNLLLASDPEIRVRVLDRELAECCDVH